ncbi:hypothetical protein IQ238_21650 [Pleurocapsales cyanobacterium LEGE 06147]|nr:hypothetical protein [Pleurocapsales cyanobacterium LEGE 06147]
MLPQFYLDYLKTYLSNSELLTLQIQILVWLLQAHRQVSLPRENLTTKDENVLLSQIVLQIEVVVQ